MSEKVSYQIEKLQSGFLLNRVSDVNSNVLSRTGLSNAGSLTNKIMGLFEDKMNEFQNVPNLKIKFTIEVE